MNYVIIGNGVAGIHAAESIRRYDSIGKIVLIGDEAVLPYSRPMISLVLEGSIGHEKLPIRRPDFYERLNIEAVLGTRVIAMDTDSKIVKTQDNRQFCYDKLLIATGADPRPINASGCHLTNIFFMRNQNHVRQMIGAIPDAEHALVLGGGLVGFKAAYGLLRRGLRVTLLIRSDYPLSMQADEYAGKMILDSLLAHGLTVRIGAEVSAFEGNGRVRNAVLSDGSSIACDMAVIGKGVLPALSFVPRDRIRTDLGILVNEYLQTGIPDVFAAGDVAEMTDIARKIPWVNAIWPEAVSQGQIAGMNMTGHKIAYPGSLGRNVIRVFDTDIMTAGLVNPEPDSKFKVVSLDNPKRRIYRKWVLEKDRLVGMVMVNKIEKGGILTAAIRARLPITNHNEALFFQC
jgi:NAD(P)H-nitrite reductase large subunit